MSAITVVKNQSVHTKIRIKTISVIGVAVATSALTSVRTITKTISVTTVVK